MAPLKCTSINQCRATLHLNHFIVFLHLNWLEMNVSCEKRKGEYSRLGTVNQPCFFCFYHIEMSALFSYSKVAPLKLTAGLLFIQTISFFFFNSRTSLKRNKSCLYKHFNQPLHYQVWLEWKLNVSCEERRMFVTIKIGWHMEAICGDGFFKVSFNWWFFAEVYC